jgi:hypothetical protein
MATPTGNMSTSVNDPSVRESLLDIITNITPEIDPLYTGLAKDTADQPYHQWLTDTLAAVATNAQAEGADPDYAIRTNPVRKANYTQIVRKDVLVSESERSSNTAGFRDRFQYEVKKAMKEWRRDTELALLRGSLNSGNTSASSARSLAGIHTQVTTLATNASGVSMSETILNNYLQNAWNQGGEVDLILVGGNLKRRIDGFSANSTRFMPAPDKKLVNTISVYVSSFGVHDLQLHRLVDLSTDVASTSTIYGIQKDKWRVAHLRGREPQMVNIAKTGDAVKGYIIGELTLEGLAENSSFTADRHF